MDSGMEEKQIQELKNLRTQLSWWKWGLFATGCFVAFTTVMSVNNSFRSLVDKGPTQDKFVRELTTAMESEIKPLVEDMAKQTLNEVQPQVQMAVDKANSRLPELAQASLAELDQLQENLPKRGEAVLTRTFVKMLNEKEAKIREMFPEATPEQVERLLTNLGESATKEAEGAAVELFGSHHDALLGIHENLQVIAEKEEAKLAGVDPSWEMGLLVLDLFREDLENARPDKASKMMAQSETSIKSANTVSTKKKANQVAPMPTPVKKAGADVTKKEVAKRKASAARMYRGDKEDRK